MIVHPILKVSATKHIRLQALVVFVTYNSRKLSVSEPWRFPNRCLGSGVLQSVFPLDTAFTCTKHLHAHQFRRNHKSSVQQLELASGGEGLALALDCTPVTNIEVLKVL